MSHFRLLFTCSACFSLRSNQCFFLFHIQKEHECGKRVSVCWHRCVYKMCESRIRCLHSCLCESMIFFYCRLFHSISSQDAPLECVYNVHIRMSVRTMYTERCWNELHTNKRTNIHRTARTYCPHYWYNALFECNLTLFRTQT